jgi:hypothetical protein
VKRIEHLVQRIEVKRCVRHRELYDTRLIVQSVGIETNLSIRAGRIVNTCSHCSEIQIHHLLERFGYLNALKINGIGLLDNILRSDSLKRDKAAQNFQNKTARVTENVQQLQDRIAGAFQRFIMLFVKEDAVLVYQTVQERVAQGLATFAFPVFRLAMTGGSVAGLMVREGPDSVSQSQAEFVDLAFRMALMTVAAPRAAASLVVDAPEASLDFLFATRAGHQLATFANSNKQNRVIVTSYLPSQHFVSAFISGITGQKKRRERIVNLISDAAANAAMRSDKAKYAEFLENIIKGRRP